MPCPWCCRLATRTSHFRVACTIRWPDSRSSASLSAAIVGRSGGKLLISTSQSCARIAVGFLALSCAGCGSIMPVSGPAAHEIRTAQHDLVPASLPYALVKLTPEVVAVLGRYATRLSSAFADRTPPKAFRFGIGDIVSVTIVEAAAGGLFTSDSGVR